MQATDLLRPGLLEGVSLLVAGAAGAEGSAGSETSFGSAVGEACTELGARVQTCVPDAVDETSADRAVQDAVAGVGGVDLLVVDGAGLYTRGTADAGGAHGGLRTCLDAAWNVTRAVVNLAFLPVEPSSGEPSPGVRGGQKIVYLAPSPGVGESAGAACAGLENLGRTLSTEWARHGITVVTIAPGDATTAGEVAALCAYLASPAGDYFSGCLLDLRVL